MNPFTSGSSLHCNKNVFGCLSYQQHTWSMQWSVSTSLDLLPHTKVTKNKTEMFYENYETESLKISDIEKSKQNKSATRGLSTNVHK